MSNFKEFIGLYPLSKTLRFELIPQGKTLQNFKASGILERDEHRAESYKKMKDIIDEYHRFVIDESMNCFKLKLDNVGKYDSLEDYYTYYVIGKKSETEKKKFTDIQSNLRKQIVDQLKSNPHFGNLFKKELIKNDLIEYLGEDNENLPTVKEFADFTTYFSGFNQNRANMYSSEEKSTSIAYRLINQNLPRFVDNIGVYDRIKTTSIAEELNKVYSSFVEYLNVNKLDELFQLSYYNTLLTQRQIDVYNAVVGGRVTQDGEKILGLNELINLYNQKKEKKDRVPKFKILYKQILSEREAISFLPQVFSSDQETLAAVKDFYNAVKVVVIDKIKDMLSNIDSYDMSHVFIKNDNMFLSEISQKLYSDWGYINKSIIAYYKSVNAQKGKESFEKYESRISKLIKVRDSFSLRELDEYIHKLNPSYPKVESYFSSLGAINNVEQQKEDIFLQIENAYSESETLLNNPYPAENNLASDKKNVELLKDLLDRIKALQWFVKPLLGNGDEFGKDATFYGEFDPLYKELNDITPVYDKVRNRMTRKPYSDEKIKLNFDNSMLLGGWDQNKEKDYMSIILEKDGLFYLGIMNKIHNKVFLQSEIKTEGPCYKKMVYKLIPGPNKELPHVFLSAKGINIYKPSQEMLENYEKGTHKKNSDNFNINDCRKLIDYFKASIEKNNDWNKFEFCFSDTSSYKDISEFYKEVHDQAYKMSFCDVAVSYEDKLVNEGKLFLFKIYNKDFSTYSKGTPNMHTLYWKSVFSPDNLKSIVYQLNGQAELFYRKSSIKGNDMIIHPSGKGIANKNISNEKRESKFNYDIIKDKRYTVDKFQFHVPITINYKGRDQLINESANQYIKDNNIKHIIGIDRGERNLLYLSLIDMNGHIVKQFSLNEIINDYADNKYIVDYHNLLDVKEGDREEARRNWQTIEGIKELKEGYLSQVIHRICNLMIDYNAIVVLENLNIGFMRGRQKVEKQVYEKFEKMLIDKLNYLVDKKVSPISDGGVLKGYQLTNKFVSFKAMGDQNGFLFYIPAWNTSKMDPVTGFVNLFDTHYENIDKTRSFFSKFDVILYNKEKNYFEFKFDYKNFTDRAEGTKSNWTLCTQGKRVETFRNPEKNSKWDSKNVNLTEQFKTLFGQYKIDYTGNLKESISLQSEKLFFEELLHLFRLTVQMRNSVSNSDIDYLISPVTNSNGNFFNSEVERKKGKDSKGDWISKLPVDADANGAYNIARKGLWVINQIKQANSGDKIKLAISNKEWLSFAQHFNG